MFGVTDNYDVIKEEKSIYGKNLKSSGGVRYLLFKYCISKERRCANLISGPSGDCV